MIFRIIVICIAVYTSSAWPAHLYEKDTTYANNNFARSKLGICFYPESPSTPFIEDAYKEMHQSGSYTDFLKETILSYLKRHTVFIDVEFVDTIGTMHKKAHSVKGNSESLAIPDTLNEYMHEYGISYLIMVQDVKSNYGSYSIEKPSLLITGERDKVTKSLKQGTFIDNRCVLSNSFWYVIIDINSGKEVQYGFVSNLDHATKTNIDDWRISIVRCWDDIVTGGYLLPSKVYR